MADITLSGLFIYPVKSLAGISLEASAVDRFGLTFDRRWMLVDAEGQFLSQRRIARMTLIRQQILDQVLLLQAPGQSDLALPLQPLEDVSVRVKVWNDSCDALYCGGEAEAWFTSYLGQSCRLVYMPDDLFRGVDQRYARSGDRTAFSDGFPLLLISEASLEDLNRRLSEPVTMQRFRPNLVVTGCEAYAEDDWTRLRIGGIDLRVVKPCSRCVITTIDPLTAESGAEPLKTLAGYRRQGNKVMFGQNLLHDGEGYLSLDLPVQRVE